MRASVVWSLIFVAVLLMAAGCSGTGNKRTELADACQRQIKQINEEASTSTIKEAQSSKDAVAKENLVDCAGQPVPTTSTTDTSAGAMGAGAPAAGAAGGAVKLTVAEISSERDTFAKTCASCHTLADAKTTGTFGPNLDQLKLTSDDITNQLANGGGGMPAGLLTGNDAKAMAGYILQVQTGK